MARNPESAVFQTFLMDYHEDKEIGVYGDSPKMVIQAQMLAVDESEGTIKIDAYEHEGKN